MNYMPLKGDLRRGTIPGVRIGPLSRLKIECCIVIRVVTVPSIIMIIQSRASSQASFHTGTWPQRIFVRMEHVTAECSQMVIYTHRP